MLNAQYSMPNNRDLNLPRLEQAKPLECGGRVPIHRGAPGAPGPLWIALAPMDCPPFYPKRCRRPASLKLRRPLPPHSKFVAACLPPAESEFSRLQMCLLPIWGSLPRSTITRPSQHRNRRRRLRGQWEIRKWSSPAPGWLPARTTRPSTMDTGSPLAQGHASRD